MMPKLEVRRLRRMVSNAALRSRERRRVASCMVDRIKNVNEKLDLYMVP